MKHIRKLKYNFTLLVQKIKDVKNINALHLNFGIKTYYTNRTESLEQRPLQYCVTSMGARVGLE